MDFSKILTALWSLVILALGVYVLVYGFEGVGMPLGISAVVTVGYVAIRHYLS